MMVMLLVPFVVSVVVASLVCGVRLTVAAPANVSALKVKVPLPLVPPEPAVSSSA